MRSELTYLAVGEWHWQLDDDGAAESAVGVESCVLVKGVAKEEPFSTPTQLSPATNNLAFSKNRQISSGFIESWSASQTHCPLAALLSIV